MTRAFLGILGAGGRMAWQDTPVLTLTVPQDVKLKLNEVTGPPDLMREFRKMVAEFTHLRLWVLPPLATRAPESFVRTALHADEHDGFRAVDERWHEGSTLKLPALQAASRKAAARIELDVHRWGLTGATDLRLEVTLSTDARGMLGVWTDMLLERGLLK